MGALSLLTPCVFPMVPITVSYFTGRAERDRRTRGVAGARLRARHRPDVHGAGALLAVGFGASGLNQFAANPWLNLGIAALFIAFALNLFGVFELALPSSLLTRASTAGAGRGRYAGTLAHGPGVHADVVHLHRAVSRHAARRRVAGRLAVAARRECSRSPRSSRCRSSPWRWRRRRRVAAAIGPWLLSVKATMGLARAGGGDEVPVERGSGLAAGASSRARSSSRSGS